jgi:hypothetical protein
MLRNIEALQLLLQRNPERHESSDQLEQDEGDAAGPCQGHRHAVELDQQLLRIALQQAGCAADRRGREHAGQQRAGQSADAMDPEDVERIVVIEALLEAGAGPEAK